MLTTIFFIMLAGGSFYAFALWAFPFGKCIWCRGDGIRGGTYCRRCRGEGRRVRLGRRVAEAVRREYRHGK